MLDPSLALGLKTRTVGCLRRRIAPKEKWIHKEWKRGRGGSRSFLSNTAEESVDSLDPLLRIALQSFSIVRPAMDPGVGFRFLNAE
jgi:hypothetical protein